ncbi:MAG TPA: DNA polymerase III subunit delta [Steroidobacteraceae bacterium]
MRLTSDSLAAHLEQRLLPVYLVSGDEPLLCGEAADAIRARAKAAGFTERETHFMERGADWNDVRASANNLSLFAERRLIEVRLPSTKPGVAGAAALTSLVQSKDPDRVLLITAPRLDKDAQNAEWVRAVEAEGALVQIWPVDPGKLVGWLRARFRKAGLQATDDALEVLAERTEGNLLAAQQEIDKLCLLAGSDQVTAEDVLASVADSARFDVFQLSEAVMAGDADRALRILAGLRAEGVEATLVLWALIKAQRDIWAALHAPPGQRPRAWARQAAALERALRRAPKLPFARLADRAERTDRMIKGRTPCGDPWDEMALLAAEMCGARPFPMPPLPMPRIVFK